MKKRRLLSVVLMMIAVLMLGLNTQAATKSVKSLDYKESLTSEIKKGATIIKQGSTKLSVNTTGYLKFIAPSSKSYSFTFSGMTGGDGENVGSALFLDKYMETLTFTTTGGKTDTAFFAASKSADDNDSTEADLASRTCKMKLNKGQVVYIFLSFDEKGSINLGINTQGKTLPTISEKSITINVNKSYDLSIENATGNIKWSSSNTSVAKVNKNGRVKGVKAGTATITAKVGSKKLKCKVTVKKTNTANIVELQKITAFYLDYWVDEALKDPDSLKVRNIWSGYTAGDKTPCTVVEYTANNSFGAAVRSYACIFKSTAEYSRIATSIKYTGKYYVTAFTSKTKTDSVLNWKKMDVFGSGEKGHSRVG